MIIVEQPCLIGGGSAVFTAVGGGVGPFLGQGAVEAFDFPVGLGPIGPGVAVLDVLSQGGVEQFGPITRPIVGHHRGHSDAGVSKKCLGALPETGCSVLAFIGARSSE